MRLLPPLPARPAFAGATVIGLVLTPLLAACSSTDSAAATVNGVEISIDALDDELAVIEEEDDFRAILEQQFGTPYEGEGEGNVAAPFVAAVLNEHVFYELIGQALDDRDLAVDDDDLDAAREALTTADEQTSAIFDALPETYQATQVERRALVQKLDEAIQEEAGTDEAVEAYFEDHADEFELLCLRHVLVSTQPSDDQAVTPTVEEATAVAADLRAEIEAGADFAAVAQRESDDGSAAEGGSLGCEPAGTYVAAFAEAAGELEVGELSEPVESEFGVHLIRLDEIRTPELEEVRDAVVQAATRVEVENAFADTEVDVNPKYGSWQEAVEGESVLGRVIPPDDPTTTTTSPTRLVDE